MKREHGLTRELVFYWVVFAGALLLRFLLLDRVPLLEREAAWANQAWEISRGSELVVGSRVGYLSISAVLFRMFGGTEFLARFWPAFSGSLLVWVPYLLRKRVGKGTAAVAAAGLALDPALVAGSRFAGGPLPGMALLLLSAAAFDSFRPALSISLLSLALLSGPSAWLGGVLLLGALLGLVALGDLDLKGYLSRRWEHLRGPDEDWPSILTRLFGYLLPGILLGSFFFTRWQGLSAWLGSGPELFSGMFSPGGVSRLKLLLALLVSNPLVVVLGSAGWFRSWLSGSGPGRFAGLWFGLGLLVLLASPGSGTLDLVWLMPPLWFLGGEELLRIWNLTRSSWVDSSLAGLVIVLSSLNWLSFTGLVFQAGQPGAGWLQLGLLAASVMLIGVLMGITSSYYGWKTARKGAILGVAAALVLFSLSSLSKGAYLNFGDPRSLWSGDRGTGQMDLLEESIQRASVAQTGRQDAISGLVLVDSEALKWVLKDQSNLEFQLQQDLDSAPPLIITAAWNIQDVDQDLYRGQDFVLHTRPGWMGIIPADWISWLAFRSGPLESEDIILWLRSDIQSGF